MIWLELIMIYLFQLVLEVADLFFDCFLVLHLIDIEDLQNLILLEIEDENYWQMYLKKQYEEKQQ